MNYNEMDVWLRAIDLAMSVYEATKAMPGDERFGLTQQMRRAAVSIPSNVAEGEGRESFRDRARFYLQARGSLYELETQFHLSHRLGYLEDNAGIRDLTQHVGRLINGVLRDLERRRADS